MDSKPGQKVRNFPFHYPLHANHWIKLIFISVCTTWPFVTLIACAIIVMGLSVGIFFMEITTDPVELWAAPHSRSRQEKDYFDNTFGPFYRTAQIFIKPTGQENV